MAAAKKAPAVDLAGWLTRNQAMDLLGVSFNTLLSWERQGLLHVARAERPRPTGKNQYKEVVVYSPDELARLPRRRKAPLEPGEIVARAFELFDIGASLRDIVIKTRRTPAEIEKLRELWLDNGGTALVVGSTSKARLERIVGSFESVDELVERISETKIDATVPDDASDEQIEGAINQALDASEP